MVSDTASIIGFLAVAAGITALFIFTIIKAIKKPGCGKSSCAECTKSCCRKPKKE